MKKLTLVLAVAAALPVMAHADVTIYGTMAMGIQSYNNGKVTQTQVDDFGSKIGFKGQDDLGNGIKTIWQIENRLNADGYDSSNSTLGSRQTFVGLQSDSLGTLKLGRVWDVMVKTEATDQFYGPRQDDANLTYPVYENGFIPSFSLGGGTDSGSGAKNSITYDMPTWNGVDFMLQYTAGENKTATKGANDRWGARLEYTHSSGLFIGGAYEQSRNQVGDKSGFMSRMETGYNGDALSVAFVYNHTSLYGNLSKSDNTDPITGKAIDSAIDGWNTLGIDNGAANLNVNSWGTRVAYTFGNFTPSIAYSHIEDATIDGRKFKTASNLFGAAVDYQISKRTMAEVAYHHLSAGQDLKAVNGYTKNPSTFYIQMLTKF